MKIVYQLQHEYVTDEGEDEIKEIGLFSTLERARETIERLQTKPGFRDYPDGFKIYECRLDMDLAWEEGFIRAHPYDPQPGQTGHEHGFLKPYAEIEAIALCLKEDGLFVCADELLNAHVGIYNGTEMYMKWRDLLGRIRQMNAISEDTRREVARVHAAIDKALQ